MSDTHLELCHQLCSRGPCSGLLVEACRQQRGQALWQVTRDLRRLLICHLDTHLTSEGRYQTDVFTQYNVLQIVQIGYKTQFCDVHEPCQGASRLKA